MKMVKESLLSEKPGERKMVNLLLRYLFLKNKKGVEEVKVGILRVMVKRIHLGKNLETGKMSSVITATKWVT